jgi:large subunit ribosomal protein L23
MEKTRKKELLASQDTFRRIVRPIITEKAMMGAESDQVTFEVALNATKPQIKEAVEALFDVEVVSVNTMRMKGKTKTFRGRPGNQNDWKKAIVRLAEGQDIDVMTGI